MLTRFNSDIAFNTKKLELLANDNSSICNEKRENEFEDSIEEFSPLNEQKVPIDSPYFAYTGDETEA